MTQIAAIGYKIYQDSNILATLIFGKFDSFLAGLRVFIQGQATDMDWTLHTDLWKSETSRDIKKSF